MLILVLYSDVCYQLLGEWIIDDSFKLVGPQHLYNKHHEEEFGQVYVQVKYLPPGQNDDGVEPPVKVNIEDIIKKEQELIKGVLNINILHGKNLCMESVSYDDIDSFVSLKVPKLSEQKSETKKNTDKPQWNFKKQFNISLRKNVI